LSKITTASLADYAAVINDEHRAAYGCAQQAIEHARVAGEHLLKAKAALKHGEWLPWLAANVEVTERQAQRYMKVAENWAALSAKYDAASYLTIDGALKELAKPKPQAEPSQPAGPKITADQAPSEPIVARELVFLQKIEGEGDKLAAALAEVKRLQAVVRVQEERMRGLQNEKNEAVRAAKMWQRKYEQAQRAA
jgi:hypothetical protein